MARGDRTAQVLAELADGPRRAVEVARALNISCDNASAALSYLLQRGKVDRLRRGLYRLAERPTGTPTNGPEAIAALRPGKGRQTVLQTALGNVRRMVAGLEAYYSARVPNKIAVELMLARTHLDEALARAAAWEAKESSG